jgi:hypothetical protein
VGIVGGEGVGWEVDCITYQRSTRLFVAPGSHDKCCIRTRVSTGRTMLQRDFTPSTRTFPTRKVATLVAQEDPMLILEPDGRVIAYPPPRRHWWQCAGWVCRWWKAQWRTLEHHS